MVLGYHVCFGTYGFWLPNDPRGSYSKTVRTAHLRQFGDATFVNDRRSHAWDAHDRAARIAAKRALGQKPLVLSGVMAQAVGAGFARYCNKTGVVVHACAILPCHVHLVIARHRFEIEQVVNLMKGAATSELKSRGLHPGPGCYVWGKNLHKVFLNEPEDMERSITYVQRNPIKDGKPTQTWRSFVRPYPLPPV